MAGRNSARAQSRRVHETSHHASSQNRGGSATVSRTVNRKMEYSLIAAVTGLAFILYWNTLGADFAYDDSRAIKTNQDLLPTTPISNLFRNDFWGTPLTHSGSHKSYRPLCVLSFRLNYYLQGFEPWGYHFLNVLLHCMVTALFTKFASTLFSQKLIPTTVASVLFAVHPIHTEAVAGVVGRADVGACLFFLLSLMSYFKYCKYRDKKLYLYFSLLCATASMLTKEHGITVLLLCAVYDIFVCHRVTPRNVLHSLFQKNNRHLREGMFHLILAAVLLLMLRINLMGSKTPDFAPADNPASDNASFLTRTLTFLYLPSLNFWLLLCPRWLSFDWSMEAIPLLTTLLDSRNIYSVLFYGGSAHFAYKLTKALAKRGSADSSALNPGVSYTPSVASYWKNKLGFAGRYKGKSYSCLLNNNNNNSSSHYSSMNGHHHKANGHHHNGGHSARATASSASTSNSPDPTEFKPRHTASQLDVLVIAFSIMVLPFIPATNLFFYVGFVIAERVLYIPSMGFSIIIAMGLDHLYKRQHVQWRKRGLLVCFGILALMLSVRTIRRNVDWWHEENLYRSGIPISPPKAYGNLANILSSQGKKNEAEWAYKKALSYRSNMADVHYNLGILLQEQGRYDESLQSYKLAIQFRPRLAMAHLNLGLVLGILGRKEEAAEVYRHCSELDSTGLKDPKMHETTKISALFNLGRLYADNGSYNQAIEVYQEAVERMPEHYQPQSLYNMMGEAFFKLKQYERAERWYHEALKAKPDHVPAHLAYAKLLAKWDRPVEAEKWFLKAKALASNDSSVYQHYGQFLSEKERYSEASDIYIRAAELAPDEYEIVFNAANTLRQAGRNAEAEVFYGQAAKLRPNGVTSHMNFGAMLHVNGKLLEAESSYMEALKLKPDDTITRNNLKKLRNLLASKGLKASQASKNVSPNKR